VKLGLGVLDIGADGRVTKYTEKPVMRYEVSMGVYVYEPRALAYIEPGEYLDFPDLVTRLLAAGEHVAAWRNDAYWLDIGNPDDYARAQEDAAAGKVPGATG
jgi:NDP-sugar pyrophosphorylase family protein